MLCDGKFSWTTKVNLKLKWSGKSLCSATRRSCAKWLSGLDYQRVYAIYNKSRIILVLAIPCIALAFDTFIFVLTIQKTIRHAISMRSSGQASVTETELFTGTNTSNIWAFITPFFDISLPNILISRLVLNLRTFSLLEATRSQTITTISGLNFATNRILGNIGGPIQSGEVEQEEENVGE
ncbi:hypothetical protein D9757_005577 [Collybiopsis confluens]|uniref:Uncharacterized protein n=1 Tax=Collybiopsis confluens TaxID=2823264 RepID=A0A8H5HSL8_9AGAR|nr:hypothetical protein D9757_005577 [Collybiopsis confluens]